MARIRTIKPEFWTSEQVADCSPIARLAFIGLWNFCDDNGIHPASVKRLKWEVFPSDSFDEQELQQVVDELIAAGLMLRYLADEDGKAYWQITGWHKHQKIERPTHRFPLPGDGRSLQESTKPHRGVIEESSRSRRDLAGESLSERPRNGMESKGVETNGVELMQQDASVDANVALAMPSEQEGIQACPIAKIVETYHEQMPHNPRVKLLNEARRKAIRARWFEAANLDCDPFGYRTRADGIKAWQQFFAVCAESKFLTGRVQPARGRVPFVATLDFLLSPDGFAKTLENYYHRDSEGAA